MPQQRLSEVEWVRTIKPRLRDGLRQFGTDTERVSVRSQHRLPYASEVFSYGYKSTDPLKTAHVQRYCTDLLIRDVSRERTCWTPRVVIECKVDKVNTHESLAYSTKAATHRQVHPYLRYGLLITKRRSIPPRVMRHGTQFDFIVCWAGADPTDDEFNRFVQLMGTEIDVSRKLQAVQTGQTRGKDPYSLFHRQIVLE